MSLLRRKSNGPYLDYLDQETELWKAKVLEVMQKEAQFRKEEERLWHGPLNDKTKAEYENLRDEHKSYEESVDVWMAVHSAFMSLPAHKRTQP